MKQFYIPEGFGTWILVLSMKRNSATNAQTSTIQETKVDLHGDDPEIGVEWPLEEGVDLIISEKIRMEELDSHLSFEAPRGEREQMKGIILAGGSVPGVPINNGNVYPSSYCQFMINQ